LNKILEELKKEASKCINCGFCDSVCPTFSASGYKGFISARGRVNLANSLIKEIKNSSNFSLNISEAYYSCLGCYACFEVCPAGVNAGKVSELGRKLIIKYRKDQKKYLAELLVKIILKYKDPLGLSKKCAEWSQGIEIDEKSNIIFYTGHMYQLMGYSKKLEKFMLDNKLIFNLSLKFLNYFPFLNKFSSYFYDKEIEERMNNILKKIFNLLKTCNINLNYLKEKEPYPGTLLLDFGYEEEFEKYSNYVTKLFHENNVETIVTIDPHTLELFKFHYPKYAKDFNFNVVYYLDLLNVSNIKKFDKRVTYHEPCHFVRRLNYNLHLKILKEITEVIMPLHKGRNTLCCGGPDAMLYPEISENIACNRFNELERTGADYIITSCPVCFTNLYKSNKVFDLAEIFEYQ
jgi:Fe-S oxidoreductase